MKKSNRFKANLKVLITIVGLGMQFWCQAGINLVGLYNQLGDNAKMSIEGVQQEPIGTMTAKAIPLPCTVNVTIDKDTYYIYIREAGGINDPCPRTAYNPTGGCPKGKACVVATAYQNKLNDLSSLQDTTQVTCVSKSVWALQAGDKIDQWQNIVLLIGKQIATGENYLPFRFGIAAWTVSYPPWNVDELTYAPAEGTAPEVEFGTHELKSKIINPETKEEVEKTENVGLRVFQGHGAWGGGRLPHAYHLHIAHIFNNTPNAILVRRANPSTTVSTWDFEKTIPPYSIMPFAMIWIPQLTLGETIDVAASNWPMEFYVFRRVVGQPLPGVQDLLRQVGDQKLPNQLSDSDIASSIKDISENLSKDARGLTGYDRFIDELKKDKNSSYYAGKYLYKLYTIVDPNSIQTPQALGFKKVYRDEATKRFKEEIVDPAGTRDPSQYKGVSMQRYLRLIIDPTTQEEKEKTKELVKFRFDDVPKKALTIKSIIYDIKKRF